MLRAFTTIARSRIPRHRGLLRVPHIPRRQGKLVRVTRAQFVSVLTVALQVGFVFAPYAGLLYFLSLVIVNVVPPVVVLPITIVVHLACWTAQVVGHVQCESNRPAMFTSLIHSVLAAPVVVYLETLFSLGLMKETQERLDDAHGLQLDRAQSTEPATTIYGTAQA